MTEQNKRLLISEKQAIFKLIDSETKAADIAREFKINRIEISAAEGPQRKSLKILKNGRTLTNGCWNDFET